MRLGCLDHVNVRTADLPRAEAWYHRVLGLSRGARPSFPMDGAWMYLDEKPIVHLVAVDEEPANIEPRIEHFALTGTGFGAFIARLDRHGVSYALAPVPDIGLVQVNIRDPDGNRVHVDFPTEETVGRAG